MYKSDKKIFSSSHFSVIAPTLISAILPIKVLSADNNVALEEMFVTAEKRLETQQDISASFNVYGADSIESSGWDDVTDMAGLIPGMEVIGVTKTRTSVFIRSIGTNKYDIGTEGSVGIFVDGIYVPRFSSMMQNIVDVDRVEVLKGPQGTLYGRNTIGGAISIYTRDPENDLSGSLTGEVGNESSWYLGSSVSGALVEDKLLGSFSFAAREAGGFRTEVASGEKDDEELVNARGKVIYNVNDNLSAKWVIDYLDQSVASFTGEIVTLPGTSEILSINPFIPQETREELIAYEASDLYSSETNTPGYSELEVISTNFTLNWVYDNFSVESITGLRNEEIEELADDDRTSFDISQTVSIQDSSTLSQEFKISSEEGGDWTFDDRLTWLAGVFLYEDDAERADIIGTADDSALVLFFGGVIPSPWVFDFDVDLVTTSWAMYSQASYALNDAFALTLGVRSSHDEKEYTYTSSTPGLETILVDSNFTFTDTLEFESVDPKVVLEWTPDALPDAMFYTSYTQGYKSGGIQFIATSQDLAEDFFEKETLKSTELGMKSRWFGQSVQFNGALYHYDYSDLQVQQIIQIAGGDTIITDNAEKSTVDGLEFELQYMVSEDWFLQLSYNYMDAIFDTFTTVGGEDLSGNIMPAAPEHSLWFMTEYSHSMTNKWDIAYRLDYSWRSEQFYESPNDFSEDSYGLLNFSISLMDDAAYAVKLFCTNCTDEAYRSSVVATTATSGWAATGDRRRIGLSVSRQF